RAARTASQWRGRAGTGPRPAGTVSRRLRAASSSRSGVSRRGGPRTVPCAQEVSAMPTTKQTDGNPRVDASLRQRLAECRSTTTALVEGLNEADVTVQSMDDASPAKWHLAHTTWFFEEFVLGPWLAGWQPVDPGYRFLFNSYYDTVGERHPRPRRGLLTRPAL